VRSPLWRRGAALALLGASLLASAAVALAAAGLTQKAGIAGCVSETGTGGVCQDGRGLAGVAAVALSPDGENAYAASSSGDGIAVLYRDHVTGVLSPLFGTAGCVSVSGNGGECQSGRALGGADDVAVSPDGKSVYVAAPAEDGVVVFSRSLATGELSQLPGAEGCVSQTGSSGCADGRALDGATSVIVSPDGQNVYVGSAGSGSIATFGRNASSGAIDQVADAAGCILEDGAEGCADGDEQTAGLQGLAISPDGKAVYAAAQARDAVTVYDRSLATGELTQKAGAAGCISETGAGGCQDGVALDEVSSVAVLPGGGAVYAAARLSSALTVFARSSGDGALTQMPGAAGCVSESGTGGACQDGRALATVSQVTTSAGGSQVYAAAAGSSAVSVFDVGISPNEEGPAGEEPPLEEGSPIEQPAAAAPLAQGTAPSGASAPGVRKEKGPRAIVLTRKAKAVVKFAFSSSPAGATLQCQLDNGRFKACKSPLSVTVGVGKHAMAVRAVNSAGASAPATYSFTVKKQRPKKR
jgi:DNA-binding beta-propeller fold protein YncE